MNDEFFKEVLEQNKDAVKQKVVEAMMQGIQQKLSWELPETIKKEVDAFITAEVLPAVKAELMKNKDVFVNSATTFVNGIPAEVGKAMQQQVAKNLTTSWNLRKLAELLLG